MSLLSVLLLCALCVSVAEISHKKIGKIRMDYYEEPAKHIPIRQCDVVIAGGGTAGVVAALAAARQGAKTILIEAKGYPGGIVVEGGTALHSFYNLQQVSKGRCPDIFWIINSGHAQKWSVCLQTNPFLLMRIR
jgi:alkyl hydroperoxide reductase subunit AhpF